MALAAAEDPAEEGGVEIMATSAGGNAGGEEPETEAVAEEEEGCSIWSSYLEEGGTKSKSTHGYWTANDDIVRQYNFHH